ncbi:hypothetical protein [Rhodopila sp.]|uniref:hypothetical protein n=1 Tax=Rhodopila sp. TaxID=2480087 RepID=UPI003D0ED6AE
MDDLRRIAVVGDERGRGLDQAKAFVGACQQQNAAITTDPTGIKGGGDLLLAETWQREGQKANVGLVGMAETIWASRVP